MCQKLWKLASSRQSYCKKYQAYFFWPTLYIFIPVIQLIRLWNFFTPLWGLGPQIPSGYAYMPGRHVASHNFFGKQGNFCGTKKIMGRAAYGKSMYIVKWWPLKWCLLNLDFRGSTTLQAAAPGLRDRRDYGPDRLPKHVCRRTGAIFLRGWVIFARNYILPAPMFI